MQEPVLATHGTQGSFGLQKFQRASIDWGVIRGEWPELRWGFSAVGCGEEGVLGGV